MLALDGSVTPYLPTKEILAALESGPAVDLPPTVLASRLRGRLASLHGVTPDRIALFPHDATRFQRLAAICPSAPWVVYSPGTSLEPGQSLQSPILEIERNARWRIGAEQIAATPPGSISLVVTPNDPTGNAIGLPAVAQLAHRAALLVLDERSAEMQRRSMIPMVEEFESIVLLRSFSDWAGLGGQAPGYAITTARIAAALDRASEVDCAGLIAAAAAVANADKLDAIAQRVRLERQRLYRMLRKLNMLIPYPSEAGYVLAKVVRGERDQMARELSMRSIATYAPQEERLLDTLRFSAISPVATRQLQNALIDIGRTVLD